MCNNAWMSFVFNILLKVQLFCMTLNAIHISHSGIRWHHCTLRCFLPVTICWHLLQHHRKVNSVSIWEHFECCYSVHFISLCILSDNNVNDDNDQQLTENVLLFIDTRQWRNTSVIHITVKRGGSVWPVMVLLITLVYLDLLQSRLTQEYLSLLTSLNFLQGSSC